MEPNKPSSNSEAKPNWHHLPNWEPGLLARVASALAPAPAPPEALKHPRWVYRILFLTKYKISRPKVLLNVPNSEQTTRLPHLALLMCVY